jgi:AbrB family looped-hinge helix DNA binding protein
MAVRLLHGQQDYLMAAIVKIDGSGRLVIPKKFRDALHLHPGTKLTIQLSGDKLILQAATP